MDKFIVNRLTEEYESQYTLFLDIYSTAVSLQQLCEQTDFQDVDSLDRLNQLLDIRQVQMQAVEKSQQKVAKILSVSMLSLDEVNMDEAGNFRGIIAQLTAILQEVSAIDVGNRMQMQHKLTSLKAEALTFQQNRNAIRSYNNKTKQYEGMYIDRNHS